MTTARQNAHKFQQIQKTRGALADGSLLWVYRKGAGLAHVRYVPGDCEPVPLGIMGPWFFLTAP